MAVLQDVLGVLAVVVFFVLSAAYVHACDRL
jgi:hypothetical protein